MSEESAMSLHFDVPYKIIFSCLQTRDVLRCMQVCKSWKAQLSDIHFWKEFMKESFDLTVESDIEKLKGSLYIWSHPDIWACRFENVDQEDAYVIRPFPSMWKCGVVVPDGFDPMAFDTKRLQSLCRSLDILIHMKEGIKEFGLECGNECSGNGSYALSTVVMPWEGDEIIPDKLTVFNKIFQFHQEIWEDQLDVLNERFDDKVPFHLVDHVREENKRKSPCLNSVFGRPSAYYWSDWAENEYDYERELAFFTWLQNIMVPSRVYSAGYGKMSPAPLFFITTLAPGWVGGILSCEFAD